MPRKRTSLNTPTEPSGTLDRPYSAINSYFLTNEELAEVNRKYPAKKVEGANKNYGVFRTEYKR